MEKCGYVPHRNSGARDGLWKINDRRQVIYVKASLTAKAQSEAAATLLKRL